MSDFYQLLDQVVGLLKEKKRVSYRALKLQFQLDDDYLDALKDELIHSKQLAADEDGKVLVWTGEKAPHTPPAPVRPRDIQPSRTREAERRQLTVMFCDLVGSTALSVKFDPEDLREIMRAYQDCCERIVERFEGRVSRFMGDGVLIHFGYPQAHEYDPEQAVRAGLAIVDAVRQLKPLPVDLALQTRVGIATGQVVVGELIGKEEAQERAVVGETPNLAARLQALANPDEVIIADTTRHLAGALFEYDDLGLHQLKGFAAPVKAWRVRAERAVESRFEAIRASSALIPLVGRKEEIDLLQRRWQQVRDGEGAAVLLIGEPGIGKSRLIQELRNHAEAESYSSIRCYCAPFHQASALHPVINQMERAAQFSHGDSTAHKLKKLETLLGGFSQQSPDAIPLLASLLSLPVERQSPALNMAPQKQKEKTLEILQAWVTQQAVEKPLLLIFEDLHWIDPTTQDLLGRIIEQGQSIPALMLLTSRPEFQNPWLGLSNLTTLNLQRLNTNNSSEIVRRLTHGKALPDEVMAQIMDKTDGIPLFVEELTKTILEAGFLKNGGSDYTLNGPLPPLAVPATLQDSLMARLDRLAPVREVAQTGALIGRQFSHQLIAAMSSLQDADLQNALDQLCEAGLITSRGAPPEAIYTFKHALVQDAAYNTLLRSKRQTLHARLTDVLMSEFPELAAIQPELLAHHYTEAGLPAKAIEYWQKAGDRALRSSANKEAIDHLQHGLHLLPSIANTNERKRRELGLQMTLGAALIAIRGYTDPAVEQTFARAESLCADAGETPELFWVVMGLHLYHIVRGDLPEALQLAARLEALADKFPDLLPNALIATGSSHFLAGEFETAQRELNRAYSLAQPDDHSYLMHTGIDLRVLALAFGALAWWHLGYPERAQQQAQQAIDLADQIQHPHTQVAAYVFAGAELGHYFEDGAAVRHIAQKIVDISEQLGFPHWQLEGNVFLAWSLQRLKTQPGGEVDSDNTDSIDTKQLQTIIEFHSGIANTYFLSMLAETQRRQLRIDEAAYTLDNSIAIIEKRETRFWDAELYRLRGELALHPDRTEEHPELAEHCFQQALQLAHRQSSYSLALRAALSLGRLWREQGKTAEAKTLVQSHFEKLTDGFNTLDLQAAKAFLS